MKTRDCSECRHFEVIRFGLSDTCDEGHKPRFYKPRSPIDEDWGYKRKCEDFEGKDDE